MTVRGNTANVAINPAAVKDVDGFSTLVPVHVDLRNGVRNAVTQWQKRPGYAPKHQIAAQEPIHGLTALNGGFAVTTRGQVYRLSGAAPALVAGQVGKERPYWVSFEGTLLAATGGLYTVNTSTADAVSWAAGAKYVALLNGRIIIAGHKDRELRWSDAGVYTTSDDLNITEIETSGEKVRGLRAHKGRLVVWADHHVEFWDNVGGTTPFQRSFRIERGTTAPHSVVEAGQNFYWFGDDGDFYALGGPGAQIISGNYSEEIQEIKQATDVYGIDYPLERVIRWYAPTHGKCFVFDYESGVFSEDNGWITGQWTRMPIYSGVLDGSTMLVGDYEPTGEIYEWSRDHKTDNGREIRVYRRFNVPLNNTGADTKVNYIRFRVKKGEDGQSSIGARFSARYRFDRGQWSDWENFSLSVDSQSLNDPYEEIVNPGSGREIELEIVETDAVDFNVSHIYIRRRELGK